MSVRYASGRDRVAAQVQLYNTPISLDPSAHTGAVVQGNDELRHYSIGDKWVALAPVLSTLVDGGNAETDLENAAKIDLGSAQP